MFVPASQMKNSRRTPAPMRLRRWITTEPERRSGRLSLGSGTISNSTGRVFRSGRHASVMAKSGTRRAAITSTWWWWTVAARPSSGRPCARNASPAPTSTRTARSVPTAPRTGRTSADLGAEGEQGDRDRAAEAVDPDRLPTGVGARGGTVTRRDDHGGHSQHDCDPENEACSPCPRMPDHVGIAEGAEDADPGQAEHPTPKEVVRAHTKSMLACGKAVQVRLRAMVKRLRPHALSKNSPCQRKPPFGESSCSTGGGRLTSVGV